MPGQDRTGPRGAGPKSGRGLGRCGPRAGGDREPVTVETEEREAARLEVERDDAREEGGVAQGSRRFRGLRRRRRRRFRGGGGDGGGGGGGGGGSGRGFRGGR